MLHNAAHAKLLDDFVELIKELFLYTEQYFVLNMTVAKHLENDDNN